MTRNDEYENNKYYKKFLKQKEKIKEKYPPHLFEIPTSYSEMRKFKGSEEQLLWKQYIKELGDLMFQPNGWFQKFTWDVMSDSDKRDMMQRAKANTYGRTSQFNYY